MKNKYNLEDYRLSGRAKSVIRHLEMTYGKSIKTLNDLDRIIFKYEIDLMRIRGCGINTTKEIENLREKLKK